MKVSVKSLIVLASLLVAVNTAIVFTLSGEKAIAQGPDTPVITHMTGDSDAVWLATDEGQLIHCWFPQDAARREERANCRVLERWRVNVIR